MLRIHSKKLKKMSFCEFIWTSWTAWLWLWQRALYLKWNRNYCNRFFDAHMHFFLLSCNFFFELKWQLNLLLFLNLIYTLFLHYVKETNIHSIRTHYKSERGGLYKPFGGFLPLLHNFYYVYCLFVVCLSLLLLPCMLINKYKNNLLGLFHSRYLDLL